MPCIDGFVVPVPTATLFDGKRMIYGGFEPILIEGSTT